MCKQDVLSIWHFDKNVQKKALNKRSRAILVSFVDYILAIMSR